MEYTEVIYLMSSKNIEDEIGNISSLNVALNKRFAKRQSVHIKEFYNAVAVGMKPSIEFVIKRDNYNDEIELKWNDQIYKIIRVADCPNNKFDIILICSKKIGVS